MGQAILRLEKRATSWVLVIEPWAQAFDVPAETPALVEVTTGDEPFDLEIAEVDDGEGVFLAFAESTFRVTIGEAVHDFEFNPIPPG